MHDNPRTPEAQVAHSLALWLIQEGTVRDAVSVSIDGAMVRVHGNDIFDPVSLARLIAKGTIYLAFHATRGRVVLSPTCLPQSGIISIHLLFREFDLNYKRRMYEKE